MNADLLIWVILPFLVVYSVSEFTCPKVAELGSSVQLLCTYSNATSVTYSTSGISGTIALCHSTKCLSKTEGYYPTFISVNKSKLEIRKVQLKDGGNWTCHPDSTPSSCRFVLSQTPACEITSGNDTNNLDIHENISLSVNVIDYYCSPSTDFLLKTGNAEEDLVTNHTLKETKITSEVFDSTFVITEKHIGVLGLVFVCNGVRKIVKCSGVQTLLKRQKVSNSVPSGIPLILRCYNPTIAIIAGTVSAVANVMAVSILVWYHVTVGRKSSKSKSPFKDVPHTNVNDPIETRPNKSRFSETGAYTEICLNN